MLAEGLSDQVRIHLLCKNWYLDIILMFSIGSQIKSFKVIMTDIVTRFFCVKGI